MKSSEFRLDLVIAVCALLISTLATAASWWQTRATYQQTQIIEEQLSAQVWPYVSFGEGINGDADSFTIENDGLGPAVIRSLAMVVNGQERTSFVDVLHSVLGPNIQGRRPRGESIGISENSASPGFVLRPGDSQTMFAFRSKTFAAPLIRAVGRIEIRTCYCAIVPGRCWQTGSNSAADPQAVSACREDPHDLLHAKPTEDLFRPY